MKLLQGDEETVNWARQEVAAAPEELNMIDSEEHDFIDCEEPTPTSFQSHLNLALLDLDDDSLSSSSGEHLISVEDYLQGRWSRTSSFD